MSLPTLFTHLPKHWKNGTTFFGRSVCWAIGENRYDALRVYKRTLYAEWWYMKQSYLHSLYINHSDLANFFALIPKADSSHGFSWRETPSRYGQFAEDTPNSDGFGGWYTYIWVGSATVFYMYIWFWPRRYLSSFDFSVEEDMNRMEMIDSLMASNYDSSWLYWWNHWQRLITPHKWHWFRSESRSHFAPDSKIQSVTLSLNTANIAHEHYWRGKGMESTMI